MQRKLLGTSETKLSPGGQRLGVVAGDSPLFIAAGWGKGVAAYDIRGNIHWKRSLPKIQYVADLSWRNVRLVGVGLDASSYRVLQAETGDEIAIFRGIKELFASPNDDAILRVSNKRIQFSLLMEDAIWSRPLDSFGVLSAAFNSDEVAYSEVGGDVICCDREGREAWRYSPPVGWHVLHLAYAQRRNKWFALSWEYKRGGRLDLLELDRDGSHKMILRYREKSAAYKFLLSGDFFISSEGEVRSTETGAKIWRFV